MSKQTLRLLAVLLEQPDAERFGLELMAATRLQSGTLYPILHRLERAGWLEARNEDIDPRIEGRPARRLYRLTGKGELAARSRLTAAASPQVRRLSLRGRLEPS